MMMMMEPRPFPFNLIVGMDEIKRALILAAINPRRMGGVIISGRRGTAKSVLARAMQRLLPPTMERIQGSPYNVDPFGTDGIDSILEMELRQTNRTLQDLPTETVATPFVTVPLNAMEDSLLGSIDIERSMETGTTIFSPGLLARAHRGILYVDEINLLEEEAANILLNVIADGHVHIEREGLSLRYPCKPLLIATYNPQEGELREHLLDRIGIALSSDLVPLSMEGRVKGVENVLGFSPSGEQTTSETDLRRVQEEERTLQDAIATARELLPKVEISHSQILYLCEEATGAGCEGQRAEIFATETAKASAAVSNKFVGTLALQNTIKRSTNASSLFLKLAGRTKVNAKDLETAVLLAIAPRGNILPQEAASDDDTMIPPPPPESSLQPLPPEEMTDNEQQDEEIEEVDDEENEEDTESQQNEEDELPEDEELEIPTEFMFGVRSTPVDPNLMYFNQWTRKGKGRKGSKMFNLSRGRFVKAMFPKASSTKQGKLAVASTLRAAAPYQKIRRNRAKGTNQQDKLVFVDKSDFRIKRMARKAGSLIIFVVDASGSMALNRMDAAKGAALSLLSEAYKSRDKICLVAFHGDQAEVLVPPTKSMALTKNRLEGMLCGGGSPLCHGLVLAMRAGLNAVKVKQDVGRVIIVLLSDGRANVPLCVSEGEAFDPDVDSAAKNGEPSRAFLKEETLAVSKMIGSLEDFNLLCIDTEDRFVGTGMSRDIAKAAKGNYFHIIDPESKAVSRIAKTGIEAAKHT